jgi:hypothetical protein
LHNIGIPLAHPEILIVDDSLVLTTGSEGLDEVWTHVLLKSDPGRPSEVSSTNLKLLLLGYQLHRRDT